MSESFAKLSEKRYTSETTKQRAAECTTTHAAVYTHSTEVPVMSNLNHSTQSPIPAQPDNSDPPRTHVERGRILPVKQGELPRARCGECRTEFTMPADGHNIHDALERAKWKYTLVNGWVCADCAPLPRLAPDAANRPLKGGAS